MTNPADDFMETALEMPGLLIPASNEQTAAPPVSVSATSTLPPAVTSSAEPPLKPGHDPIGDAIVRFTDDLRSGLRPKIEEYLSEVAHPWREALFTALLRAELESQCDSDEPLFIFRGQYLERFPDRKVIVERLLSELEARISTFSHSDPSTGPVETVTANAKRGPSKLPVLPPPAANTVCTPSAAVGQMLDRFELLGELGAGTNGKVFLARDPRLGREVAIKIPHPDRLRTAYDVERFLRTARAAAQFRHEYLCPIYEVNDVPGNYYLVMAFIKGRPLGHFLADHRRLPIKQAVQLTKMLATAMIEPHQKGIVHRDLKPDNIQIDEERRVPVIMDFGLARFEQAAGPQLTHDGQLLGTPYYMPPEQALGDTEQIGPRSDLYSLGVIFYEMLTGQRPITGRTVGEVLKNVHSQQPIPPLQHRPQIDQTLNDLCLKSIAKSPADRFASMAEFAKELSSYLKTLKG